MSDRRPWARKTLAKLAAELSAGHVSTRPEIENSAWSKEMDDQIYRAVLNNLAADPDVEKIVAEFGGKIPLPSWFVAKFPLNAEEKAVSIMMRITAFTVADPTLRMLQAKKIVETREKYESLRAEAAALRPIAVIEDLDKLDAYSGALNAFLELQVPLDHPMVERRTPSPRKKDFAGRALPEEWYSHARAARELVRSEARKIFGKAGDRVTDVFMWAATGVSFSRDDGKTRVTPKQGESPEQQFCGK
jgi:hypothetical protein